MRNILFFFILLFAIPLLALSPPIHNVVVLNISNGNYEFSSLADNKLIIFDGSFAELPEVVALFKGRPFPEHYLENLSLGDAYELIMLVESQLPAPPIWLKAKKTVLAIGGKGALFSMGLNEIEQPAYITKEQIWDLLLDIASKGSDLKNPRKTVETTISLSLIYALMDHFEIENLTYFPTQ